MALSTISGTTGITDATVTSAKLADFTAAVDLNGVELLLDADADTSISADTDDQIDIKIANTDHLKILSSSGDTVLKPMVDAKDIIFQQYDGNKIFEINGVKYLGADLYDAYQDFDLYLAEDPVTRKSIPDTLEGIIESEQLLSSDTVYAESYCLGDEFEYNTFFYRSTPEAGFITKTLSSTSESIINEKTTLLLVKPALVVIVLRTSCFYG